MTRRLKLTKFRHVDLADPFFDSLKAGYAAFPTWFAKKADDDLYVVVNDAGMLSGMIYLKAEIGSIKDIVPPLPHARWMKVGTLKIEGKGTKLGERVLKKIFDTAIQENMDGIYVTVFELHSQLIALFERYGFSKHATKTTVDGVELVLVRDLRVIKDNITLDYPLFKTSKRRAWLLAVYPEYHSQLLPDSILNNEPKEIVKDVSHTNTIHKIYIGRIPLNRLSPGDVIVIYRTSDNKGPAYFRSVVSSVGVVEEVKQKSDFASADDFVFYASPHSVFSPDELRAQYVSSPRLYTAKFTYNAAFAKRITRGELLDDVGVSEQPRWDLRELSIAQLKSILNRGKVNERIIVD